MKKLLLCVLLTGTSGLSYAQKGIWNNMDLSQFAWTFDRYSMNPTAVLGKNPGFENIPDNYGQADAFNYNRLFLNFELTTPGVYVATDLTWLSDATVSLFKKEYLQKEMEKTGYPANFFDIHLGRLAFGGYLNDNFGMYFGGQYSYSLLTVEYFNNKELQVGGNQRGGGAHFFYGTKYFLLKYSFMYDWIRRDKKAYKGHALTHEATLFIPLDKNKDVRLFGSLNWRYREMEPNNSDEFNPLPQITAVDYHIRVGISVSGVMGSLASTTSRGVGGMYGN